MKRLYSVVARAPREVVLTDPDVLLEAGSNVIAVTTADIDGLVQRLEALGVTVRSVHCIAQTQDMEHGSLPTIWCGYERRD